MKRDIKHAWWFLVREFTIKVILVLLPLPAVMSVKRTLCYRETRRIQVLSQVWRRTVL